LKQALCIHAVPLEEAGVHPLHPSFFKWAKPTLRPRPECETDQTYYQLIPYIVLMNTERKIYCYVRGKAGDEGRLHDKLSIGLGGHVDAAPIHSLAGNGLLSLLQAEASRELFEETGVLCGDPQHLTFQHYIVDHTDEVGMVHLGLLTTYMAGDLQLIEAEKNVIEDGAFRSLEDLCSTDTFQHLEKWSQHVVCHLHNRTMDL
jgi:predicted NUDIX family phosphoesterase